MEQWFKQTILGLKLCPFAQRPFDEGRLRLIDSPAQNHFEAQQYFIDELDLLDTEGPEKLATTLIGFPDWDVDFPDFLDFCHSMEELLEEIEGDDVFQLVAFHPEFQLQGFAPESLANYPNSSPYPVLHILRRADITAVQRPGLGVEISEANEARLRALSPDELTRHYPWKN